MRRIRQHRPVRLRRRKLPSAILYLTPSSSSSAASATAPTYSWFKEVSAVGRGSPGIASIHQIERIGAGPADEVIPFRDGGETRYGNLVPFGLDSNGNEWSFIVEAGRPGNEYEVAYFDTSGRKLYGRLGGFTDWLSVLVKEQEEVIRTLYGDDVIYEELMLG
jgi:hypothetical protein